MKHRYICQYVIGLLLLVFVSISTKGQETWFADGYHGGVYGHYPMWQARFMVDKLTENPNWRINLEIEPETWDTVSVKDAANFKALQDYYSKIGRYGRIEFVNPTYAQPYCYNIPGESIIRQFAYGMDKTLEYFPEATFLTYACEEPCFTSSLPQVLKSFGYKYAVLRNPNTCWGGYTSGFGKDMVNWIGPDGTSIPCIPRYACEWLSEQDTWTTASNSNSNEFIAACFADGIKYPVGMTFQDAGWDRGPWGSQYKPTIYTTWTEYVELIKNKVEADNWHFSLEDVKPGLVWGAQVLQKLAQQIRVSENRIIIAEKMATLDYLNSGVPWPTSDFAEAWRTLMLAQHHDCWIVPYNGRPGNTWADKVTDWTNSSNQISDKIIAGLYESENNSEDKFIRVFNTTGSSRSDLIFVSLPEGMNEAELSIIDKQGVIIPSQQLTDASGNKNLFFEANIPGIGYSTFKLIKNNLQNIRSNSKKNLNGILNFETDFYTVKIDPSKGGTITSLVDKRNGNRELVQAGKALNDLRGYFYKEKQFHHGSESKAQVSIIDEGELFTRVKVENNIAGQHYIQLITFARNNPRIDFELHIDWNGQPGIGAYDQSNNYKSRDRNKAFYNDQYKLHLQFPLNGVGDRLYKNAPFDVCESHLSNTLYSSWDSIKHNVVLNWVNVENANNDYGVALFTDHTTSYLQTEELPLGLTVQYVGKALWGRDYGIHGPTHIRYALLPHSGNWEEAEIELESIRWNEPLIGSFTNPENDEPEWSLFELTDKNLHVSAMSIAGEDLLVRFYNTSSKNKKQKIQWNCTAEKIELIDLNGKVLNVFHTEKDNDGRLVTKLSMPQFGFQTLKLTNAKLK